MSLQPKTKRRIIWTSISLIAVAAVAVIIVPPFITLNSLKPRIEKTIFEQTGISAKINGDVHFSLLGRATIIAHDIEIPMGTVGATMFSIPLRGIFDIASAPITGDVSVYRANVTMQHITPPNFNHNIAIYNSNIRFGNETYEIIRGNLGHGHLTGTIRAQEHKYSVDISGTEFKIRNNTNNLDLTGQFFDDGTARGHLSMDTDQINKIFNFQTPQIPEMVSLSTNFEWDGANGYELTDLHANNIDGKIIIRPNGTSDIKLKSQNTDFDFSFLLENPFILQNAKLNLDLYGNLIFANQSNKHLQIVATGTDNHIQIDKVIADDVTIIGGTITPAGLNNLMITIPYNGTPATCLYFGKPNDWYCENYSYGDITGTLRVVGNQYNITCESDTKMPQLNELITLASAFGNVGIIDFKFSDATGKIITDPNGNTTIAYSYLQSYPLRTALDGFEFLPPHILDTRGDFSWDAGQMTFTPKTGDWRFNMHGTQFSMTGGNIKDLFPSLDLQSINNAPYTITGNTTNGTVSDLVIKISDHEFTGTFASNHFTLHTPVFNLDTFISQKFIDNYDELEFLTVSPITIPFELKFLVSLSADKLIYRGTEYNNFVYSLKPNLQTFSISDKTGGTMLASFQRDGKKYELFAALNKFALSGQLLNSAMPLNVQNATVTAEIDLTTSGHIAHDLAYNIAGTIDATFTGGQIVGIGIDEFFASADNINTFNAEYALANAFDGGASALKSLRIVGKYDRENFITTRPFELQLRHSDATGTLEIHNDKMNATLRMILRGTSPAPAPIDLEIAPNGARSYSLSEIMQNFDSTYMRNFVKTHNKF